MPPTPTVVIPPEELDDMENMSIHICGSHTDGDRIRQEDVNGNDVADDEIRGGNGRLPQNANERGVVKFKPGKTRVIWEWSEVKPGKFVYIKYYKLWHAGLVTGKSPDRNVVKIVHYALPDILSSRVVSEDEFRVDLDKNELWEVYVPPNQRVSAAEAVQRARARIGQKGFNMFTHRSSHLVKECVMRA